MNWSFAVASLFASLPSLMCLGMAGWLIAIERPWYTWLLFVFLALVFSPTISFGMKGDKP